MTEIERIELLQARRRNLQRAARHHRRALWRLHTFGIEPPGAVLQYAIDLERIAENIDLLIEIDAELPHGTGLIPWVLD